MTGYTKLFGSIIASTIWREKNETRIVWVTMLAMANKNGVVEASIPGLADMSRVTIEACEEALNVLSSPDQYSRTKDWDGRRIESVDGGWAVLNHSKYRAKMSADDRRDYLKIKQREYRVNSNNVNTVSTNVNKCQQMSTLSTQSEAEAEARKTILLTSFAKFWNLYPKKKAKGNAIKAWKKINVSLHEEIFNAILKAKSSFDWQKDGGQFIPHPATWLNSMGWEDDTSQTQGETLKDLSNYQPK